MSIFDLGPGERNTQYGTPQRFVAAMTREELERTIYDRQAFSAVCCIGQDGVLTGEAARIVADEIASRGK